MTLINSLLLAVVFAIGLSSASPLVRDDGVNSRIFGGFTTRIELHPWQVSLQSNGVHICGGSIIAKNWVLTGAQCGGKEIRVGSTDNKNGGSIIAIRNIIRHEKYNSLTLDYDFALLELNEPLNFSAAVQPITLPDSDYQIDEGESCEATGWGWFLIGLAPREILRETTISSVSQEHCREQYSGPIQREITDRMICAGSEDSLKGPCFGDEGGPLVYEENDTPILVGVTSWSLLCGITTLPGVYSRVSSVRPWIKSISGV